MPTILPPCAHLRGPEDIPGFLSSSLPSPWEAAPASSAVEASLEGHLRAQPQVLLLFLFSAPLSDWFCSQHYYLPWRPCVGHAFSLPSSANWFKVFDTLWPWPWFSSAPWEILYRSTKRSLGSWAVRGCAQPPPVGIRQKDLVILTAWIFWKGEIKSRDKME